MTAKINDKAQENATCINCHAPLASMQVSTSAGNQVHYICPNEGCPRGGTVTVRFNPPADTGEKKITPA